MPTYEEELAALEGGLPEQQADSLLDKTIGVLNLPRRGVESVFSGLTGIDIPVSAGASLREATGFAPTPQDTIPGRLLGTGIEFAGDIAADPLTYLGVGLAGKAAKVLGARKALQTADPLAQAAKEFSLKGVTNLDELKNLTVGMNRFLPEVQMGADIGFGSAAGLGAIQAGGELVPQLMEQGITPETAELAARTALAGGAATLPFLQAQHIRKDQANWTKLQDSLRAAREAVPPEPAYPVNAPRREPTSPYDLVPPPVAPRNDIPGYGQEVPVDQAPADFLDLLSPEQREVRQPLPPPAAADIPGYGAEPPPPEQLTMFGAQPQRIPEPQPAVDPISVLADKIVSGAKEFSAEEFQLQMNYPRELEAALTARTRDAEQLPLNFAPPPTQARPPRKPAKPKPPPTTFDAEGQGVMFGAKPQPLGVHQMPDGSIMEDAAMGGEQLPLRFDVEPEAPPPPPPPKPPRKPPTPRPEQLPAEDVDALTTELVEPEGPPKDWVKTDLGQAFVGLVDLIRNREVNISTKELDQLAERFGITGKEGGKRDKGASNQRYAERILAGLGIDPTAAPQVVAKRGKDFLLQGGLGYQAAWQGAKEAARLLKSLWTRRTRQGADPEVRVYLQALEDDVARLEDLGRKEGAEYASMPERTLRHDIETIKAAPFEPMSLEEAQARSSVGGRRRSTQELFEAEDAEPPLPNLQPVRPRATDQPIPPEPVEAGPASAVLQPGVAPKRPGQVGKAGVVEEQRPVPTALPPGGFLEGSVPKIQRTPEGTKAGKIGAEFTQRDLEAARAGRYPPTKEQVAEGKPGDEAIFDKFPQQKPKRGQRAEIDPKIAAMFEGEDANDFLFALRQAVPKLYGEVQAPKQEGGVRPALTKGTESGKAADRFNNALANFLRRQDWTVPEKLKPDTMIRMGSRYIRFGDLVEKYGKDRAEFIAAFQRYAAGKGASAAARLEEKAGGISGRDVARRAADSAFHRELYAAHKAAEELGEKLSTDDVARIKKRAYDEYGLGTKEELDRPVPAEEGKTTTPGEQLSEEVDYNMETTFRFPGTDEEKGTLIEQVSTVAKQAKVAKDEIAIMEAYFSGGGNAQDLAAEFNMTPQQVLNRFHSGVKKLNLHLRGIAAKGDVGKYVRGQKGGAFNPVVESVADIISKGTNKQEVRNTLVALHRENLLAHIDKVEKDQGVGGLGYLATKLGYTKENSEIWKNKPNATRMAREIRKALGVEKKPTPGATTYAFGVGGVDPALLKGAAKAATGAVANLIRRLTRGSEGTPVEMEGVAKTVAETAPKFEAEPTTEQIEAAYAGPKQAEPTFKHTKPSPTKTDRRLDRVDEGAFNTFRTSLDENNPTEAETMKLMQDLAEVSGTRERTTFQAIDNEATKLVDEHGYDAIAADINNKLTKGYVAGPEYGAALRRYVIHKAKLMNEAKELEIQAARTGDVNVMREAHEQAARALAQLVALQGVDQDVARVLGQALVARRMGPQNVTEDIRGRFEKQLKSDPSVRPAYVSEIMTAFDGFMQHRTPEYAKAFHTALSMAVKKDWWDMFSEAYRGWLISPASHVANAASNTIQMGVNTALKQTLTPAIDAMLAKKTGTRSIYAPPIYMVQEAMAGAFKEAFPQAMKDLRDAVLAREYVPTPEELVMDVLAQEGTSARYAGVIPNPVIGGKKVPLGEMLRTSYKLLSVGDTIAKHVARAREYMQSAYTWAKKQQAAGGLTDEQVLNLTQQRLTDMVDWRTNKLGFQKLQALHGTERAKTLRNELTTTIKAIDESVNAEYFQKPFSETGRAFVKTMKYNPVLRYIDTLVLPFKQTPWNIAAEVVALSPIPGIKRLAQLKFGDLAEMLNPNTSAARMAELQRVYGKVTQEQVAHEIAKSSFGTAVMGTMFYLANSDILTGGGPVDPRQQALKRQTGWQPYSINIGKLLGQKDEWVSFQRLEPFSSLFGFASDMSEGVKLGDFDKASTAMQRATGSIAENLTNKTFLSGMEGLFTMFHDPKQYMSRFVKQLQGSLVPNVIGPVPFGSYFRAADPLYRQTEAFTLSPMQAKLPGSTKLLPQVGPSGEVRKKPGESTLERLLSPFPRSKRQTGAFADAADILNELGYAPSLPPKTEKISGRTVQLTEEEQKIYMRAQEQAAERVARISKDPTFKRLPKDLDYAPVGYRGKTQKSILESVYQEFRGRARKQVREMIYRRKGLQ